MAFQGEIMTVGDHEGWASVPGRGPDASPGRLPDCPSWCDGQHEVDEHSVVCHSCIVAQYDTAIVALSCAAHRDPPGGDSVVILDLGTTAGPTELEESDAIRLLGTLEVAGDGPAWLIGALRSALELLDPQAGWVRPRLAGRLWCWPNAGCSLGVTGRVTRAPGR
jgi:hypothetical protein